MEDQAFSVIADSCADSTFTYSFSNLIADNLLRVKVTSLSDSLKYQMSDSYFSVYIPEIILQKRSVDNGGSETNNLRIAPNPIVSDYTIENSMGITNLEIFTSNGESVYSESYSGINSVSTPFRFLNKGIFCIKITNSDGIISSKLIIVR